MSPISNWFERNYYGENQTSPKVNRVAPSGARILHVGQQRIEYVNMAGQERFIDLEECARNWVSWVDDHEDKFMALPGASEADGAAYDARCVCLRGGRRHAYWAEFMDEHKTRFEFQSFETYWKELEAPLTAAGWCTFDTE